MRKHGLDFADASKVLDSRFSPEQHFVWDGKDEDDRPASTEGLAQALQARRGPGRPAGSGSKEQVAIRFERDVLEALRATGPGW